MKVWELRKALEGISDDTEVLIMVKPTETPEAEDVLVDTADVYRNDQFELVIEPVEV